MARLKRAQIPNINVLAARQQIEYVTIGDKVFPVKVVRRLDKFANSHLLDKKMYYHFRVIEMDPWEIIRLKEAPQTDSGHQVGIICHHPEYLQPDQNVPVCKFREEFEIVRYKEQARWAILVEKQLEWKKTNYQSKKGISHLIDWLKDETQFSFTPVVYGEEPDDWHLPKKHRRPVYLYPEYDLGIDSDVCYVTYHTYGYNGQLDLNEAQEICRQRNQEQFIKYFLRRMSTEREKALEEKAGQDILNDWWSACELYDRLEESNWNLPAQLTIDLSLKERRRRISDQIDWRKFSQARPEIQVFLADLQRIAEGRQILFDNVSLIRTTVTKCPLCDQPLQAIESGAVCNNNLVHQSKTSFHRRELGRVIGQFSSTEQRTVALLVSSYGSVNLKIDQQVIADYYDPITDQEIYWSPEIIIGANYQII